MTKKRTKSKAVQPVRPKETVGRATGGLPIVKVIHQHKWSGWRVDGLGRKRRVCWDCAATEQRPGIRSKARVDIWWPIDITGARWSVNGTEAVLKLRAVRANDDFDKYWTFHLNRERQRVHETRYAHGIIPLAA